MIRAATTFEPQRVKESRVLEHDRQLACCRFSPRGEYLLATGFDGTVHRWRLEDNSDDKEKTNPAPETVHAHCGWVESLVLHPDGERFYTADSWGKVCCWPAGAEKLAPSWTIEEAHASWLRKLTVSPDGRRLATCGNDRMVRVFSADDGKPVREFAGHRYSVQSVAFHNDGKSLASGDQHGVVRHWSLETGECLREFDAGKLFKVYNQYDQGGVRTMTFDDAFKTLYAGGFEGTNANQAHGVPTVLAFDWESGKQQHVMTPAEDFKGPIVDLIYHPAGYVIGAGSSEAGGMLWFFRHGEAHECHKLKNVTSFRGLALHADGLRLAATAFGDRGGQRGGNGRRLNNEGEYEGFAGNIVLYSAAEESAS